MTEKENDLLMTAVSWGGGGAGPTSSHDTSMLCGPVSASSVCHGGRQRGPDSGCACLTLSRSLLFRTTRTGKERLPKLR